MNDMTGGFPVDASVAANFRLLQDVDVRLTVEIGRTQLTLRELLALGESSVIELDRQANELLDVFVNGTLIGRGEVRHTRLRPVRRAFRYPTWFLLLPMRTLRTQPDSVLARNRAGLVSFHDRDHGDGGVDALVWFERLLADEGITDADGEVCCTATRACSATPSSR